MDQPQYRLAEIAVDLDGNYWTRNLGLVPEQGGMGLGWLQCKWQSLQEATDYLKITLRGNRKLYRELIAKKEARK